MYDAIMHERERVHYRTYMCRTIYHICMHVDHLHREIFHAECWEFRPLCDNVSLKRWLLNMGYTLIFLLKKCWVAFAFAKGTHIFSAKIHCTCELNIVLTRAVIILTTNELVKLTTLWTTGPRALAKMHTKLNIFLSSLKPVLCTL